MNTLDDIEIYAKNLTLDTIIHWLSDHFSHVIIIKQGHRVHDLHVRYGRENTPVMIVEHAAGKAWSSIWFKTTNTPWEGDQQCAESLNNVVHCCVRFNAIPWQQGAEPDQWQQLDEQGQLSTVQW